MSLKGIRHFVHKKLKAFYGFNPKEGHEKYQYRCPFCSRMTHSDRFLDLKVPVIDASIMVYGGYRGIKVYKSELSIAMRLKVLGAMKEKIKWLYEKIGGEEEWLRSRSASILTVRDSSLWRTVDVSRHLKSSVIVNTGVGEIRSAKIGIPSAEKLAKL